MKYQLETEESMDRNVFAVERPQHRTGARLVLVWLASGYARFKTGTVASISTFS